MNYKKALRHGFDVSSKTVSLKRGNKVEKVHAIPSLPDDSKYAYPLKLQCVTKQTPWGGSKLSERYNKPKIENLGECWELSVREKEKSAIANGICKGLTLEEYLEKHTDIPSKDFPLLIKLLDAREKLSVQVHPQNEKTEMWHIVEADPGASIIFGIKDGVSLEEIAEATKDGSIEKHLNRIRVSAGETYFIPAGTVHAIGEGIVIAEIQQNSDTTYRFYDYGRPRELHTEKALESIRNYTPKEIDEIRFSVSAESNGGALLAACEYFTVIKHDITDRQAFSLGEKPFVSLLCTEGNGKIVWCGGEEEINVGDCFFIPTAIASFEIRGNLKVISTTI